MAGTIHPVLATAFIDRAGQGLTLGGDLHPSRPTRHSHGYLQTSGLPTLYADYAQNVTVEGDNYLLTQQTARYLLKMYEQGRQVRRYGCICDALVPARVVRSF